MAISETVSIITYRESYVYTIPDTIYSIFDIYRFQKRLKVT